MQLRLVMIVIAQSAIVAANGQESPSKTAAVVRPYTTDVRVNLTPSGATSIKLASSSAVHVFRLRDGKSLGRLDSVAVATLLGSAKQWSVGGMTFDADSLELVPEKSPAIWIDDHQYRGRVRLIRDGTRLVAVNMVNLEEYIASVVDSEMPLTFGEAARQAQAVVARTYVLYQRERSVRREFDVYASTRSQKYLGFQYRHDGRRLAGESESSRKIARETAGLVCTYHGRLFCTYYSAVCGGRSRLGTEVFSDAAKPLQAVKCEWCERSPLYRWDKSLSLKQADAAVKSHAERAGKTFDNIIAVERKVTDSDPSLHVLQFSDGQQTVQIPTDVIRSNIFPGTLPSSMFVVRIKDGRLVFSGAGHGHRVGLCQWGASGQAKAGHTCLDIIRHYYPESTVVRLVD